MNSNRYVSLGAIVLLALILAAQPARCAQSPAPGAAADIRSSLMDAQEAQQLQHEVQAELAKAQAELARALEEVKHKTALHQKELARKLSAHRAEMIADLEARTAELSALAQSAREKLAQEHASRVVEPLLAQSIREGFAVGESDGGWLGVQIADVDAQKVKELKLPAERGVLITEVDSDSPAAKAGLKVNDVITEFNGQRVESAAQFRRMVRESLAGRVAQLTLWRDGRAQSLSATLGSRRDRAGLALRIFGPHDFDFDFALPGIFTPRAPLLGISAEDISGQLGTYFGAPGGEGILVREVNSGSPAEKAGMKAGDVITKIDGERVRSLSDLREKLRAKREQKTVGVGVIRKGSEVSLNVEIEQPRAPERRRIAHRSVL